MKTIKKSVVFMAGGLGSRYNGLKQIDGILENGSPLLEYSLYDAIEAGFTNFVFIINDAIPSEYVQKLKHILSKRNLEHHFVVQKISDFVISQNLINSRQKPWGTGHAVLCAKSFVDSNFVVINADDYYGKSSLQKASKLINENQISENKAALIAYKLKNTLSDNGTVARGLCTIDENGNLQTIEELTKISKDDNSFFNLEEKGKRMLNENNLVSMNFWIFHPSFFEVLEDGFQQFIENNPSPKAEYYLPTAVVKFMEKGNVQVLESQEIWKGVTYSADKKIVQNFLQEKIDLNEYPSDLWK